MLLTATLAFSTAVSALGQVPAVKPAASVRRLLDQAEKLPAKQREPVLRRAQAEALRLHDRVGEGRILSARSETDMYLANYPQCIRDADDAIALAQATGDDFVIVDALDEKGAVLNIRGERTKGLLMINAALRLAKTIGYAQGIETSQHAHGDFTLLDGRIKEGICELQQTLPLAHAIPNLLDEAAILNDIGYAYTAVGDTDKAILYLNRSLPLSRKIHDRNGEASTLNNIGLIYYGLGDLPRSIALLRQSAAITHEIGDVRGEATIHQNIGSYLDFLGHEKEALAEFEATRDAQKRIGDPRGEAATWNAIGIVYDTLGQREHALHAYETARSIQKRIGDALGEAVSVQNIGQAYDSLGQNRLALQYLAEALPLQQRAGNRAGEAVTRNNIGKCHWRDGDYAAARTWYEDALKIEKEIKDPVDQAITLANIGSIYRSEGQFAEALDYYRQSLALDQTTGNRDQEAKTLANIGLVDVAMGKTTDALGALGSGLSVAESVGDRETALMALAGMAHLLGDLGQADLAIIEYKLAVNVCQSLRQDIAGLPAEDQAIFVEQYQQTYRTLADLLIRQGRLVEAQEVLDLLKDQEFFRFLRQGPRNELDLTSVEREWKRRYDRIGMGLSQASYELSLLTKRLQKGVTLTPSEKARMAKLKARLETARRDFDVFLKDAAAAAKTPIASNRIAELGTHERLAHFVDGQSTPTAAIYTLAAVDGVRTILTLPHVSLLRQGKAGRIPFAELCKKIALLRTALSDPRYDPIPLASDLYDIIVRPIEPELTAVRAQRLMWSLDGPLRYLPLAALYDRETHQYLIDKYPSSLFVPADLASGRPHSAAAIGFGTTREHRVGNMIYPAIPNVREELGWMRDRLGARVFLNAEFTGNALRRTFLAHPSVVHVATHFELQAGDARNSFLLLGDGSPLRLSEFASWRQGSAHAGLLVLSACNTATPDEAGADGGECEGFARTALDNGAAAVIASLWPVADQSTALLMKRFYDEREAHRDEGYLDALRRAQKWLRSASADEIRSALAALGTRRSPIQYGTPERNANLRPFLRDAAHPFAHPFFWAPFVINGSAD